MTTTLVIVWVIWAAVVSTVMARRGVWSAQPRKPVPAAPRVERVLVIGATGGTGRQLVAQALERGLHVTAFVRKPAKLELQHPRLRTVKGNVLDYESVEDAVRGQDAVLSALGHRRLLIPDTVQTEGMRNIIRAMKACKVRRLICETSLGLGSSVGRMGLISTLFVLPAILPIYFWDKSGQEQLIGKSDLDWIIVRPGVLTNRASRKHRHGVEVGSYLLPCTVSRAAVAEFMLDQLADNTYLQTAPGIC